MNILVTSIGGDIGQNIIKCLKELNYNINLIGCDIDAYAAGRQSVDSFYCVPRANEQEKYINKIQEICKIHNINYIIPTNETEISLYDIKRKIFEDINIKILINNSLIINTFLNKYNTIKFFKNNNISYPKTYILSEYNNELKFPIICKPENGCGGKKIQILYDEIDLNYVKIKHNNAIIQEIIGNIDEEYTIGIFSDGKIINSIAFRRYLGYGSMTKYAELIIDKKIQILAEKIAKSCQLKGSINVQVRKVNNEYIPFEINPRFSSSVYFRHFFGFKDVEWWLNLYQDVSSKFILKYKNGIGVRTVNETFFELTS